MRAAFSALQAAGFSSGQLPFELFDAVAMSEEEAQLLQADVNVQRVIDETLRNVRG